jgi:hypothetical protein
MPSETIKISGVALRPPSTARKAAGPGKPHAHLAFDVANSSDKQVHVWATRRAYDYDPDTRVLTLYLTEHTPPLPPGIKMLSDHPRNPTQVPVPAKGRATIEVPVPDVIRKRTEGKGLGMSFVEVPITQVDRVDLHVQFGPLLRPVEKDEGPDRHRARLRANGEVVHTSHSLERGKKEK